MTVPSCDGGPLCRRFLDRFDRYSESQIPSQVFGGAEGADYGGGVALLGVDFGIHVAHVGGGDFSGEGGEGGAGRGGFCGGVAGDGGGRGIGGGVGGGVG